VTELERARRVKENERLFALVNEAIHGVNVRLGVDDETEHDVCECSIQECAQRVALTREEYAEARSDEDWYFMLPAHQDPAHERVLRETDRYLLVEKTD
jgi:hypothetical protein